MKYPKVKKDRRKTISEWEVSEMHRLYRLGNNPHEIAKILGRSHWAVYSRVDPRGIERKRALPAYQKEWKKQKLQDPVWRDKYQNGKNAFIKRRYKEERKFRDYMLSRNRVN